MKKDDAHNPTDRIGPDELIDAYFDRELPARTDALLAKLIQTDPVAAALFAQSEKTIEAIRQPIDAPDLSTQILAEVGRRRGWIGARVQRLVSVGRVAVAATILLALAVTLTVRRLAPDAVIFPATPTPIADVTDCAASDANCNVSEFLAAMDQVGASIRLNEVRRALPGASARAMQASFVRMQMNDLLSSKSVVVDRNCPDRRRARLAAARPIQLSVLVIKSDSLKKLTDQSRVRYGVRQMSARSPNEDEKSSAVGGW